jgi:LEA14-like dessication related protein
MKMKRLWWMGMLLGGAGLLAGCGRSEPLEVGLVTMRFQEAAVLETTVVFTLRISNPNPEPLKLTGSVHKFYLNGLYLGQGMSDAAATVPRLGTVNRDVVMHISNLALATRLKAIVEAEGVDYRLANLFYGESQFARLRSESAGKLLLKEIVPELAPPAATPADAPAAPTSPASPVTPPPAPTPTAKAGR